MRGTFGLIGVLIALLVVGSLVRKQMASTRLSETTMQVQAGLSAGSASAPGNVAQQSQQVQQQIKQAMDAAMQARPMPDDK
jgi:predicted lipid-binding transport protein (Tim44 family)